MLSRVNITVFISVAIGVALSFFIYFWQNQAQQKLIQEKFKTQIDKKTYEIQDGLELNMHALNSLAAFYHYKIRRNNLCIYECADKFS